MKYEEIEMSKTYEVSLENKIQFGDVGKTGLQRIFSDRRILGLACEELIASMFDNMELSDSKTTPYDVIDSNNKKYEVRTVGKSTTTCPSYMIGIGRKYNKEAHQEKLDNIDAIIFIDTNDLPSLKIYPVDAKHPDLLTKNLTRGQFTKLVNGIFHPKPTPSYLKYMKGV